MALTSQRVQWVITAIIAVGVATIAIPRLESGRTVRLLKAEGATFDVSEEGSLLWMTLSPSKTTDDSLLLLRNKSELRHLTLTDCPITDVGIENLGTLDNLTQFDLSGTRLVTRGLDDMSRFAAVTDLRLARCPWVDDEVVGRLAELKELRNLDLDDTSITDACVADLAACHQLTNLNLANCVGITDAGIRELVKLPNLHHINVSGTSLSVDYWQSIWDTREDLEVYCPLEALKVFAYLRSRGGRFAGFRSFSDPDLHRAFAIRSAVPPHELQALAAMQWQRLSIVDTHADDASLAWLGDQRYLRSINLTRSDISDSTLKLIAQHGVEVAVFSETQITDRGIAFLGTIDELKRLELARTQITGLGFGAFVGSRLEQLDLRGSTITDIGVAHFANLPALHELILADTGVTDAAAALLGRAPALESLNLDGTDVRGEGLAGLSQSQTLTSLSLRRCPLRDELLHHVAELPTLDLLILDSRIGDRGVEGLSRAPKLSNLWMPATDLTPNAAASFARMERLAELKLTGVVSDALLSSLGANSRLARLDLSEAAYNDAAADALQKHRPQLFIRR